MPANVGAMFYYGETPWHGKGVEVAQPLTMEQALQAGGLDWKVGELDLQTCEDPPSPTTKRKALVRLDREPGDPERVLGVVHLGFKPLQNRDGARLFDAIFGDGKAVYHTGGYLGCGEVVWLMAKIEKTLTIGEGDIVQLYALFANSHDGSEAFSICLTTVRVVCQNTLKLALREKGLGEQFRRSHQSTFLEHWGALNAVTEYVDHHRECKADRVAYALLGDGMDLKLKAYKLIRDINNTTAV